MRAISINMRADMFNTMELVIAGVLAETMDKQAARIAQLEDQLRRSSALEQRALRLSMKPKRIDHGRPKHIR